MKKTTRFPFFFFIAELAYVVWVAFRTYHLDLNHDDDAALFYRLSLFFLIGAGLFFKFETSTAKYKKLLFIVPLALWASLFAGGKILDYDSEVAHREKFLDVAEYGNSKKLKSLQNKYTFNQNLLEEALHKAISGDNGETVLSLHELGCPLDYPPAFYQSTASTAYSGINPGTLEAMQRPYLHQAVSDSSFEAIDIILDSGIPLDLVDREEMTALHYAAYIHKPELVEYLLKKGADPQTSTPLGLNALFFAVNPKYHGKLDEVKEIITLLEEYGADLHCTNSYGHTLLDYGYYDFKDYIKGLGIGEGVESDGGVTALHKAAEQGDLSTINQILEDGSIFIDYGDRDWYSPLFYAINSQKIETVRLLVESGADVNLPDKIGVTPLMYACYYYSSADIPLYLLEQGADLFAETKEDRFRAMDCLVENSNQDFAVWYAFIGKGAKVDSRVMAFSMNSWYQKKVAAREKWGAGSGKYRSRLQSLDESVADFWALGEEQVSEEDWSMLLSVAAQYSNPAAFQSALAHGESVDSEQEGNSVLKMIFLQDGVELMKYMVATLPQWENLREDQMRLNHQFHRSVEYGATQLAAYFIELGAEIHSVEEGSTAALFQVQYMDELGTGSPYTDRSENLVALYSLLIKEGADLEVKNESGETPLEAAEYRGTVDEFKMALKNTGMSYE